jgi:hypothetical protein
MTTYWRSGSIAPRILDQGTRWRSEVSFRLRPHYPQSNRLRYSLDKKAGGPQSRSGHGGEDKNFDHCICRELNPGHPAYSLVSILSELLIWVRNGEVMPSYLTFSHSYFLCLYDIISIREEIQMRIKVYHKTWMWWCVCVCVCVCMYVCMYVCLCVRTSVIQSFWTGRLERELQMVQLSATRCSCIAIL